MRIGLLGFGTVGKGVYELTSPRPDMQVVRVLCRRDITLPDAQVTHDFGDILQDLKGFCKSGALSVREISLGNVAGHHDLAVEAQAG